MEADEADLDQLAESEEDIRLILKHFKHLQTTSSSSDKKRKRRRVRNRTKQRRATKAASLRRRLPKCCR